MKRRKRIEFGIRVQLDRGQLLGLCSLRRGTELVCLEGRLWYTATGDRQDHVLVAGNRLRPIHRRRPVVCALERSIMMLVREPVSEFSGLKARPLAVRQ